MSTPQTPASPLAQFASIAAAAGVMVYQFRADRAAHVANVADALGSNLVACAFEKSQRFYPDIEAVIVVKNLTLGHVLSRMGSINGSETMYQTIAKPGNFTGEKGTAVA